jgi:hypothetical protein
MQICEPPELFNRINNERRLFFVDVRGEMPIKASARFRGSVCLSQGGATHASLLAKALVSMGSNLALVIVFDPPSRALCEWLYEAVEKKQSVEAESGESKDAGGGTKARRSVWAKISSVRCLEFGGFYLIYSKCRALYAHERDGQEGYPSQILPGLFLGDYEHGGSALVLGELGITHVVDATNEQSSKLSAGNAGAQYLPVDVLDAEDADLAAYFDRVNAFADACYEADGRMLIHCRAGKSRSAALVLAYMLHCIARDESGERCKLDLMGGPAAWGKGAEGEHKLWLSLALQRVLQARPWVCPNVAFRKQLRAFELR